MFRGSLFQSSVIQDIDFDWNAKKQPLFALFKSNCNTVVTLRTTDIKRLATHTLSLSLALFSFPFLAPTLQIDVSVPHRGKPPFCVSLEAPGADTDKHESSRRHLAGEICPRQDEYLRRKKCGTKASLWKWKLRKGASKTNFQPRM